MSVMKLLQVVLSKAEKGLWYDHDERGYDAKGWGICLKLFSGIMYRPITKPKYWFSNDWVPSKWNEFTPEYHWLLKIPVVLAPFVSVAFGERGFYFGFKVFSLDSEKYRRMTNKTGEALTFSVSTRNTRWK